MALWGLRIRCQHYTKGGVFLGVHNAQRPFDYNVCASHMNMSVLDGGVAGVLFKTPVLLAAVYIRMVFTHFCGGRQGHSCAVGAACVAHLFVWFLLNHSGNRRRRHTYLGGFINIAIHVTTLSPMSQRCHRCHNIVVDITTLSSIGHAITIGWPNYAAAAEFMVIKYSSQYVCVCSNQNVLAMDAGFWFALGVMWFCGAMPIDSRACNCFAPAFI